MFGDREILVYESKIRQEAWQERQSREGEGGLKLCEGRCA